MLGRIKRGYAAAKPILEIIAFAVPLFELVRYSIIYFISELPQLQPTFPRALQTALIVHTVVILMIAVFLSGIPRSQNRPEYNDALAASRQFVRVWRLLWVAFLIFYGARTWSQWTGMTDVYAVHLILDSLSLAATGSMLLCYIVLAFPAAPGDQFEFFPIVLRIVVVGALLIAAEAVATYFSPDLKDFFDGAQGMIAGIITALLVGQLDSKLIASRGWIIVALYGYAVLQLAYPVLESTGADPFIPLIVLSLALVLKVLLFWHVQGIIVSGRIAYYMFEYREISKEATDLWEQFKKSFFPEATAAAK